MKKSPLNALLRFFSSFGLAIVVLLFLFLLTLLGTLEQARVGLYEVQDRYFSAFFLVHEFPNGLKLPLPGVYLLSVILSINLLVGMFVRMRPSWAKAGIYVIHVGILFMLLAGLVTHHFAIEGQMTLAPDQSSSRFSSYHEWELVVADTSTADHNKEYVVPEELFADLSRGQERTIQSGDWPFDVVVGQYARNGIPQPERSAATAKRKIVDGFFFEKLSPEKENERNLPGLYLALRDKQSGERREAILWGGSIRLSDHASLPLTVEAGGKQWDLKLQRRTWTVPFTLKLNRFIRELHPGTSMPRAFRSDVTKIEGETREDLTIKMNHPLRHKGLVFFQASFFENPRTGQMSSTFAVVRNPADQWPLVACIIISVGLLTQFGITLVRYLRSERARQAR